MLQRFRNLVEDVIEVTRVQGTAVVTTIDEVKRVLTKGEGSEANSILPQSGSGIGADERRDLTMDSPATNSTSSKDDEKNLLKDIFDIRNFSLSTKSNDTSGSSVVQVRQISSRKYRDSDSSEGSVDVESPQLSGHNGSGGCINDPFHGSVHANSSSFAYRNETLLCESENNFEGVGEDNETTKHRIVDGNHSNPCAERFSFENDGVDKIRKRLHGEKEIQNMEVSAQLEVEHKRKSGTSAIHHRSQHLMHDIYQEGRIETEKPEAMQLVPVNHRVSQDCVNDEVEGRSSLSSAASSSMPSIAVTLTANTTGKNSGTPGSEEDNEDIGEVFAAFGPRKANSHTNLSKLSPFSKKRMGFQMNSRESIVSCYSNAGEENCSKFPVTGEILFGLNYNYRQSVLEVNIKQCRDLAAAELKKSHSDPYVKTYLLPDRTKNGKRKTRIKKHSLNPVFDEVLKYHVTKSELETRTLSIAVLHNDRFGRNDFLGEVIIPLDYYSFDNPAPAWHKLQDRNPSPLSMLSYKGDLSICLKFVSAEHISGKKRGFDDKGELHVIVKEACNLTAVRTNGFSDPFCKGYLLPDKSHDSKRKSPVIRRNCNPKWNHIFIFDNVSWDELHERSLELAVWDHDLLTTNDFLGGVRLNLGNGVSNGREVSWMDSTPEEIALWQSMLDRPNCWIEGTLLLRLHMNQLK